MLPTIVTDCTFGPYHDEAYYTATVYADGAEYTTEEHGSEEEAVEEASQWIEAELSEGLVLVLPPDAWEGYPGTETDWIAEMIAAESGVA